MIRPLLIALGVAVTAAVALDVKIALSTPDASSCYHSSGGKSSLHRPSHEVERPGVLYANVSGAEYLIVSLDWLYPSLLKGDTLKRALEKRCRIPAGNVLLHANHNHQSRGFDAAKMADLLSKEVKVLRNRAVEAEMAAVRASAGSLIFNRRIPVSPELGVLTLGYKFHARTDTATGRMDLGEQVRDFFRGAKFGKDYDTAGSLVGSNLRSPALRAFTESIRDRPFYADGPVDTALDAFLFREKTTRRPLGGMVRFAAHRSACPPFLTDALSRATEGTPWFFLMGCSGDLSLLETVDGSPQSRNKEVGEMRKIAGIMADRLIACFPGAVFRPLGRFEWRTCDVRLPVAEDILKNRGQCQAFADAADQALLEVRETPCTPLEYKKAKERSGRGWGLRHCDSFPDTLMTRIFLLSLNETAILALPGEILTRIHHEITARSGNPALVTVELCEDGRERYVPHPDDFPWGGYEVNQATLSPAGVRILMDAAVGLVQSSKAQK